MGSAGKNQWVVHKFGGTSVADAECFRRVGRLMHSQPQQRQAVVVSAMGGMTNSLLGLIASAEQSDGNLAKSIDAIRSRRDATRRSHVHSRRRRSL